MQPASVRARLTRRASFILVGLLLGSRVAAGEVPAPAPPADALSAEIALTSDYVYRGLSFSDGRPAVQAAVTWVPIARLHLDGWASSVDFGEGDPTDAELSATLGYEMTAGAVTLDAGVTSIVYAGAPRGGNYDYVEIYGAAHVPVGSGALTAALHYTPRYSGDAGPALFSDLEGSWPFGGDLSAVAVIGQARLDPRAGADYVYWQAGLAADAFGVTFNLRYHGNTARACTSPCADRVALTVSKAF